MPASSPIPSLTQVRAWDTGHLTEAANHWSANAIMWEDAFSHVSAQIANPAGAQWEGEAAKAAQARTYLDRLRVTSLADQLHDAASIARRGADQIEYAKHRALDAVRRAEDSGFDVGEDFSISSEEMGTLAQLTARQAQAEAFAAEIHSCVGRLVESDLRIANAITSATAGIGDAVFGESGKSADGDGVMGLVDFKQSPADDNATPEAPGGGYGSYHYGYQFTTSEGWTKEQIMSEVQKHFNTYFTFTGDADELVNGATINLKGPFGENEPVRVTSMTPDGFSFVSLPGHNEGAGRTITFSVAPSSASPVPGRLNWELRVAASGPLSGLSVAPGASWFNKLVWHVFADNLGSRLPARPAQPGLVTV